MDVVLTALVHDSISYRYSHYITHGKSVGRNHYLIAKTLLTSDLSRFQHPSDQTNCPISTVDLAKVATRWFLKTTNQDTASRLLQCLSDKNLPHCFVLGALGPHSEVTTQRRYLYNFVLPDTVLFELVNNRTTVDECYCPSQNLFTLNHFFSEPLWCGFWDILERFSRLAVTLICCIV